MKIMKTQVFFFSFKGSHIRAARVFLVRCAVENPRLFALWWHLGSQSLVWSVVVVCFHFNFSAPSCFSANGPLARATKRHRGVNPIMAGMNPFLASMFGPAFALPVPTRADIVLMDR